MPIRLLVQTCLFLLVIHQTFAQETFFIKGSVCDNQQKGIAQVQIQSQKLGGNATSDSTGHFSIETQKGDTLTAFLLGYTPLQWAVTSAENVQFTLSEKQVVLPEVEVTGIGYGQIFQDQQSAASVLVSDKQLGKQASPSPMQQLQGRVAGVQIISESGQPGAEMRVRIRGIGTVNNSNPIYVVDGFQTSDIGFLSPNDIEKIEVLKDASAAAIYGSRGANGVLLITTKKSSKGKVGILFDTYVGIAQMWRTIPVNNAAQYAQLRKQAFANDGIVPNSTIADALNKAEATNEANTNWQKEISRTATIKSYHLSIGKSDSLHAWRFSGTLFDQEGTIRNTGLKKYFLNLKNDYQIARWLKAGAYLYFARTEQHYNNANEWTGSLNNAVIADPITPVRNPETGNWGYTFLSTAFNPARVNDLQKNNLTKGNQFAGIGYADARIYRDLSFRSVLGLRSGIDHNTLYVPTYNVGAWEQNPTSVLFETRGQTYSWGWSNYANYEKTMRQHTLKAMLGAEGQANTYSSTSVSVSNVPENDQERYISASLGSPSGNSITSNQGANAMTSYFGRLMYHYAGRYIFTASLRRDGSSKFAPNNRWGTFPAFSVAWNLAKERFLINLKQLYVLKLRAGWGKVGNQNSVGDYAAYTLINGQNNYSFGGSQVAGFTITDFGNPLLQWEKTETQNMGLDVSVWQQRVSFTADYFVRNTTGMIMAVPSPLYAGANGAQSNVGSVRNKGLELALHYQNKPSSKFHYQLGFNFSTIQNRVTNVGDAPIKGGQIYSIGYMTSTNVGMPIGSFYGLQTDGIFHSKQEAEAYATNGHKIQPQAHAGDVKFVDQNGDGRIDDKDLVNLGSPLPKYTYGFSGSCQFFGFDLQVYLMGVQGNKIVNGLDRFTQSSTGQFNSTPNRLNAWTAENPSSNEPRMTASDLNGNTKFSDRFVKDGSYLRLQNLILGYSLPQTWVSKAKLSQFRMYIAADNLWTKTHYQGFDPEIGQTVANGNHPLNYGIDLANYPQPRMYRAGVTLQF